MKAASLARVFSLDLPSLRSREKLEQFDPGLVVIERIGNRKRNRRNCSDKQSEFWMVKGLENTSEEAWF